jgi:hypothetical protein
VSRSKSAKAQKRMELVALNVTDLESKLPGMLTALEKVFGDIEPDLSNPLSVINISKDMQTIADAKQAYADLQQLAADL